MRSDKLTGFLRVLWTALIIAIGAGIYALVGFVLREMGRAWAGPDYYYGFIPVTVGLLIVGWFIAKPLSRGTRAWIARLMMGLSELPVGQVLSAATGMSLGILLGLAVSLPFRLFLPPVAWAALSVLLYVTAGSIGGAFAYRRWREILNVTRRERSDFKNVAPTNAAMDKILDTSVIIDGRILDVLSTGFVEGVIVIPQFVLAELRHIADSPDPMRRNRGRRGLDILARIQRELAIPVEVDETNADNPEEVDAKLLKLAQTRGGAVVTNDFNLNKVASVTGVRVLNLNDLTNALKPALLPGEECTVQIVREGKEPNQGVGFLEDGTMIVVDNARRMIGERVEAVVTTALQTSAGRMIFARLKYAPARPFAAEYGIN